MGRMQWHPPRKAPAAHESALDERTTNSCNLHRVQDQLRQTMFVCQRRSQKTHTQLHQGRKAMPPLRLWQRLLRCEWQEETKRLSGQKFAEAAGAQTTINEAIKRTPKRLRKQIKKR